MDSTTGDQSSGTGKRPDAARADMKLEIVVIAVSDVDRAKDFYGGLGWRLDADVAAGDDFRLIQFTPPGSGCSIQFGTNLTSATPGSDNALFLIVSDIDVAHGDLVDRGVQVTDVYHCAQGAACRFRDGDGLYERVSGQAPGNASYGSFVSFSDPDDNAWVLQEVTTRLPGRVDTAATSFSSASDLAAAMARAERAPWGA